MLTFLTLIASAALPQFTGGAIIHQEFSLDLALSPFDYSGAAIGDVDGDGIPDVVMSSPDSIPLASTEVLGFVEVFSGATGQSLWRKWGTQDGGQFGSHIAAAGDVNADGIPDVLVGANRNDHAQLTDNGAVFVLSGSDGTELAFHFGSIGQGWFPSAIAGAGDLDGDGHDDYFISDHDAQLGVAVKGMVLAISGATGLPLYTKAGSVDGEHFGTQILKADDLDGDAIPDLVVGDLFIPGVRFNDPEGRIQVFSGATGNFLYGIRPVGGQERLGIYLMSLGDVNGDGLGDFASATDSVNAVVSFSGADGSQLYSIWNEQMRNRNGEPVESRRLESAGDVNGDGYSDILLSTNIDIPRFVEMGSALIYSGEDGAFIARFDGDFPEYQLRRGLGPAGDFNGDGKDEFLVHFNHVGVLFTGMAALGLESHLLPSSTLVSLGLGETIDLEIDFPDAAAGLDYAVLMSTGGNQVNFFGVDIPLGVSPFLFDSWVGNYPFAVHNSLTGSLNGSGDASADFVIPNTLPPSLEGVYFWMSAVAFQPGGIPEWSTTAAEFLFLP